AVPGHDRGRQERLQVAPYRDGAGSGTAGAVRAGEGLVDVVVHHVGAEVARTGDAQDRVHVGAVEIDQSAAAVDQLRDRRDLPLEQAERVGVGNHEGRGALVELGAQVVEIDQAAGVALDRHRVKAGDGGAGRVGAVGAVGDEDAGALLAAIAEVGGG